MPFCWGRIWGFLRPCFLKIPRNRVAHVYLNLGTSGSKSSMLSIWSRDKRPSCKRIPSLEARDSPIKNSSPAKEEPSVPSDRNKISPDRWPADKDICFDICLIPQYTRKCVSGARTWQTSLRGGVPFYLFLTLSATQLPHTRLTRPRNVTEASSLACGTLR